jgi:hypothetical protein
MRWCGGASRTGEHRLSRGFAQWSVPVVEPQSRRRRNGGCAQRSKSRRVRQCVPHRRSWAQASAVSWRVGLPRPSERGLATGERNSRLLAGRGCEPHGRAFVGARGSRCPPLVEARAWCAGRGAAGIGCGRLVGAGDGRRARPAGADRRGRRERDERPDGQRPEASDADRATDRPARGTDRAREPTREGAGERTTTNRADARDKPDDRYDADTTPQHDGRSAATTGRPDWLLDACSCFWF